MNRLIANLMDGIEELEKEDREILHLTAYDNAISFGAQKLLGSVLSQRYQLGTLNARQMSDPVAMGEFLLKGLDGVDQFERAAQEAACEMFSASTCDFRPLSGMHTMLTSLVALTRSQDVVYSIECESGGHFATHKILTVLDRRPAYIPMDNQRFKIDLQAFAKKVQLLPPRAIYFDVGCALFPLPLHEIRHIVGPDVLMIYDASHTFGLIAGGVFQSPLEEGADLIQGNTHKTFPGPQKGMLCFKELELAQQVQDALTAGLVSSPHLHHCLALYLTLIEMKQFGKEYAEQMVKNAKALAHALMEVGVEVLAADRGFTQSNVLLIKGGSVGGHVAACRKLYECQIATNSRHGFDQEVLRLGVQEVTRKGMKEEQMREIALLFKKALKDKVSSSLLREEVKEFTKHYQQVHYSFDNEKTHCHC